MGELTPGRPLHKTVLAFVAAGIVVFLLVMSAVAIVDQLAGGPESRRAIEQSEQNGRNLCEFADATAKALSALAQTSPLTPDQRVALRQMHRTARDCTVVPTDK